MPTLPLFPHYGSVIFDEVIATAEWAEGPSCAMTAGQTDPLGGTDATLIAATVASGVGMDQLRTDLGDGTVYTNGARYRVSVIAKSAGMQYLRFVTYDGTNDWGYLYDLTNGTIASARAGGGAEARPMIVPLGNGWYVCSFEFTGDGTAWSNHQLGPSNTNSTNFDAGSTQTIGQGVYVYRFETYAVVNTIIDNLVKFSQVQRSYPPQYKTVTIPSPVANDSVTAFWTNSAIVLQEIRSAVRGNTSPQTNFTIASGSSRDGVGNTIMQANIACSNITAGNTLTTFSNNTIAANSFVWVNVLSTTGNVDELHISLRF